MVDVSIVTDSAACLPRDLIDRYNIHVVPAGNVLFEGKVYRDGYELTYEAAYRMLEIAPHSFFTSPISPNDILQTFEEAGKDARRVLYISISSRLSTLYNSALLAKRIADNLANGISVEVFDSETVTAAQGFVVLAAARAAAEGKSFIDVMAAAESVKSSVDLCYVIENVQNLYRSGRIPKAVASVGSKLNAMPLVTIRNNSVRLCGIVRTRKKGIEHMMDILKLKAGNIPIRAAVLHADAPDEARDLYDRIYQNFDCFELWISQFSPLMAYTTGRGVIGVAFYADEFFEG